MNRYLKFAYKCILMALPFILVIAFTFCFPMAYMDVEYPGRAYTHDVIDGDVYYDTVILGDSRAVADILPGKIKGAVSLANGGATAIENYYYLKNYIENHGAPKSCIIGFAPFHFDKIDNFWNRTVYFNDLSVGEMFEVRRMAANKDSIVRYGGDTADLISNRLRLPHVYMPALINSHFVGRYKNNKELYAQISSAGGHQLYGTADGCSDLNYEVNYTSLDETGDAKLIRQYLLMLMDLCEEQGIETYVITLPMNESSYNSLDDGYVLSLSMFLRSLGDLYKDAVVETEQISYEDSFFGDSSHLNEKGAEKFTEELIKRLNLTVAD